MATLNEMIAQGAQFYTPDPTAQYNKLAQMQKYQQENELARYTMAKAQQEDVTRNALNQAYQSNMNPETGEINYAGVYRNLGAAGAGASIPGIQKTQFEAEQQRQLLAKTRQETFGLQNKAIGSALTTAMSDPSDAGLNQAFDILDRQKIDTKSLRSQLLNIQDPAKRLAAIRGYATAHPEGIAAMKFVAPDPLEITKGDGSKIFVDKNPNSPTFKTEILPSQVAGMTPAQAATVKTGQDQLKVSQDRLAFDRDKLKYEQDNPGFTIERTTQADGSEIIKKINKLTGLATNVMDVSGVALTGVNLPAQTAAIRQKFDQDKLDFERKNPGFTIEKATQADGTEKFKKINKQTGEATDVIDASGTALTGAAKTTLSPLATLQRDLTNAPPNSKQADQLRAKILKEITDTSQAQLKLAQDRFAWDKANPGYYTQALNNEDGSQRFVAVNRVTLKVYPLTESAISSGTPPNIGAPLVGPAAGVTPAPVAAQTSGAPAMPGQPVPLTSARPYKEPTVSEQNAGYNISRVLRAATSIQNIIDKDPAALAPKIGEAMASSVGLGGAANVARTGNRQIVYGAQRDVVDALLYLATGAAYNKEQLAAQLDTYMPQYTDKPENVIEKQQRLVELISDAKSRAGKAWTPKMDAAMNVLNIQSAAPAAAVTPSAGFGRATVVGN